MNLEKIMKKMNQIKYGWFDIYDEIHLQIYKKYIEHHH